MLNKLLKISTSLLTIPCCVVLPFTIANCKNPKNPPKPPKPVRPVVITEPNDTTQEVEIKNDGTAQVVFAGFKFSGITDQTKLNVGGTFSHGQTEFEYILDSFDIYQKTFGIFINITNATPVNDLTGIFTFTYNGKQVIPEKQSNFHLTLLEHKTITLPEKKDNYDRIVDGKATIKFYGFKCTGMTDIEHLTVLFSGKPTLGECTSCEPFNYRNGTFDISLTFENVAAETVVGSFQFYYDSSLIDAPTDNFYCTLERETEKPDFEDDSWENVIWYSNFGLSVLQEHYGVASFVGLKRNVRVLDNHPVIYRRFDYPVTVIGQNHDHFKSGNPVCLSFQFDNVSCHHVGDVEGGERTYAPYKIPYDDDRDVLWWYDPENNVECGLRKYLREELFPLIEDIGQDIKPVMKQTMFDESKIVESRDILWALSPTEMGYNLDTPDEGECYQYYLPCKDEEASELRRADNLAIYGDEPQGQYWWTRSPFVYCDGTGSMGSRDVELGVRICFCI